MNIKLTPTEFELIEHRLEVPDALADCLSDDPDEGVSSLFDWDEVFGAVQELTGKLRKNLEFDAEKLQPVEIEILRDCIDGSTFFASSEGAVASGEITRGWLLSRQKAARSIEEKFTAAGINNSGFPAQ